MGPYSCAYILQQLITGYVIRPIAEMTCLQDWSAPPGLLAFSLGNNQLTSTIPGHIANVDWQTGPPSVFACALTGRLCSVKLRH